MVEVSVEFRFLCKNKVGIDVWFWVGEEGSVGFWFWNGEEAGNYFSVKDEDKVDSGFLFCVEKLEFVGWVSCKVRLGVEEEEEENVIGNWFWDGDEISFDFNFRFVSRIVRF